MAELDLGDGLRVDIAHRTNPLQVGVRQSGAKDWHWSPTIAESISLAIGVPLPDAVARLDTAMAQRSGEQVAVLHPRGDGPDA